MRCGMVTHSLLLSHSNSAPQEADFLESCRTTQLNIFDEVYGDWLAHASVSMVHQPTLRRFRSLARSTSCIDRADVLISSSENFGKESFFNISIYFTLLMFHELESLCTPNGTKHYNGKYAILTVDYIRFMLKITKRIWILHLGGYTNFVFISYCTMFFQLALWYFIFLFENVHFS